ncbi:aldo/keto reductase [Mycolicibacterium thermoresistibile]
MATIGASGITIFPLALGANTFGWTSDESESERVLDAFTAAGGNFIDTADMYSSWVPGHTGGESETIIGRWLRRRDRDTVVVATKVGAHPDFPGLSARNIAAAADASLQRLQTDYIDVYYVHYDDEKTPLTEAVAAFEQLVTAGKVRHVGLSNMAPERITEWLRIAEGNRSALPVALQPQYNLVHRRDYEQHYAPLAQQHGLAVFPYYSLASGFLSGKYRSAQDAEGVERSQMVSSHLTPEGFAVVDALEKVAAGRGISLTTAALAWLLHKPGITAPLASARTTEQLPDLLTAVDIELADDEIAVLDDVSRPFA